jgi:predicted enzyme involved in methoxymalonyl-ACP biosynthesis
MSCRVFSRNLEFAMFDYLVKLCKKNKISNIHGNYIKSEKNFIVKDFFKTLNFKKIKNGKNNTKWEFKIGNKYTNKNKIIKIKNEK